MSNFHDPVLRAATRASLEQIELARQAVDLERWLRGQDLRLQDRQRLLEFVAQVRLISARTGGDLSEILLLQQVPAQTDGG